MSWRDNDIKMYKGKTPCQGCGEPGSEKPRDNENCLCGKCSSDLNLGRVLYQDKFPEEYKHISVRWYSISMYNDPFASNRKGGPEIESAITNLLKILDRKNIKGGGTLDITEPSATTASNRFTIRSEYAQAIKDLVDAIIEQQKEVRAQFDQIKIELVETKKRERNKIFNEGLEVGKSLLLQLNDGKITMEDFGKSLEYNK